MRTLVVCVQMLLILGHLHGQQETIQSPPNLESPEEQQHCQVRLRRGDQSEQNTQVLIAFILYLKRKAGIIL